MGSLRPTHYRIHLIPDLSSFAFEGEIDIDFIREGDIDTVILNALDIQLHSATLNLDNQVALDHTYSLEDQELRFEIPQETKLPESFTISIKYAGEINDKLAGLYRSPYEVNGEQRFCAVTQFQENDARRAFPCVDNPGAKATFDISFTVENDQIAISNTSIQEETQVNGKKHVVFERTPIMSTYLVFFGIGEFEWIEDTYRDNIPMKVITSPGKAEKYGKMALDFGKKSLKFCEEYFGIDYPLSKLDHIGTPAFAAGAMENWGAILYRENVLLYYPGITSKLNEVAIKEVIAHETTHQWFGNLVSPNSWKYVWLNESFATFFAYGIVDHYEPEVKVWDYFVLHETDGALTADGYHETVPIEMPGEEKVSYTTKSVPILYNKGGSVLRQVKAYLGDDGFKDGLHHYLSAHAYDVATSDQLWEALEQVSGKPISKMMESWVLQFGYPVVSVERDGHLLRLRQERFTYLDNTDDTLWYVPITMKLYFKDKPAYYQVELLKARSMELAIPEDTLAVKINLDQTGFYRVKYSDEERHKLGQLVQDGTLGNIDRWTLENDMFAFLRSNQVNLDEYLDFIKYYENETDHLSLNTVTTHLDTLYTILKGASKERLADVGKAFLDAVLNRVGYDVQEGEHHTISTIRGNLLLTASKLGLQSATDYAMDLFAKFKEGEAINPDYYRHILFIAAEQTNDFDWFVDRFRNAENEVETIYYGTALSQFTDPSKIEQVQQFIFDEIPARNRGNSIVTLCRNEHARKTVWEWYIANMDNFEKLHHFIYQHALTSVITASVEHVEEIKEFFKEYIEKNNMVKDSVEKALETLEIRSQFIAQYE